MQPRVLPPTETKRKTSPVVTKKPSASSNSSLDFRIKTLEQIRAEKRKRIRLAKDGKTDDGRNEGLSVATVEVKPGDSDAKKRDESADTFVPRSPDEMISDDRDVPSDKEERPKSPPRKRRLIIKRSSLHKSVKTSNRSIAESAEKNNVESNHMKFDSSGLAATVTSSQTRSYPPMCSTKPSSSPLRDEHHFDATCIDRSHPLPDRQQEPQTRISEEQNKIDASGDHDISVKTLGSRETTCSTKVTQNTHIVLKLKRSTAVPSSMEVARFKNKTVDELLNEE